MRRESEELTGPEREEHERAIADLIGELAASETARRIADESIEGARQLAREQRTNGEKVRSGTATFPLDFSLIGWIKKKDSVEPVMVEEYEDNNIKYYFSSLIGEDSVTKNAFEALETQGLAEELIDEIKRTCLPELWERILSGDRKLRPVSVGGKKKTKPSNSLNTTYPAYKIDVRGTNNRAVIIVGGRIDGAPVFFLAALYDHDDQPKIDQHMFLNKTKKS